MSVARRLPAPLHRFALRLAHAVRRRWWRWAKPALDGVSVAAFDKDGRVLLVRHGYGRGLWALPGGGVRRGEAPEAAAAREFAEELGVAPQRLVHGATIEEDLHGARNRVFLFSGMLTGPAKPDGREVIEARWFAPDALPGECSVTVASRLALLQQR